MKQYLTLILTFLAASLMLAAAAFAVPYKFANILNGKQTDVLPMPVLPPNIQQPTASDIWEFQKKDGWRTVLSAEEPAVGFRVDTYSVKPRDGETCTLVPSNIVDIAAEQAAIDEAKTQAEADAAAASWVSCVRNMSSPVVLRI